MPTAPVQALVTIAAPIPLAAVDALTGRIEALGNPAAAAIRARLDALEDGGGTHFMSLHAIPSGDGRRAYLLLELSGDGDERAAVGRVAEALRDELTAIFADATDWKGGAGDLASYLLRHRVNIGHGWFSHPGLAFSGTPDMRVGRIHAEAALATRAADLLAGQAQGLRAIERLAAVRAALQPEGAFADLLAAAPPPLARRVPLSKPMLVAALAWDFARTYLWPIPLIVAAAASAAGLHARSWGAAGHAALAALGWSLLGTVVLALVFYALLRHAERSDVPSEDAPAAPMLRSMAARENHGAQNHMISITRRKAGLVRWFALRLVMWLIAALSARKYQPGHLGDIGTIHFARWVTIPGTRDYVFFSNFGGSWESYLEDFITRAHKGLTAAWSSSEGFPRSANLVQGGATDGERFKRYGRRSMRPTAFWYSAYPALTTGTIRANAAIRRGLVLARGEADATRWLALFGSAARPANKIESSDIQSLVFGGLGFMPHGCCLLLALPGDTGRARAMLARLRPHIAFNDGRLLRADAVLTLALGHAALSRLGLPEPCVEGFPAAYAAGMTDPDRARILGDGDPGEWWWGTGATHDLALLLYGKDEAAVAALEATVGTIADEAGGRIVHRIPLKPVGPDKREPFGFVDGISQPLIRGTYKGLKSADPIHLVEPGEFLLGYPDNRSNLPPGPRLAAAADPLNLLPVADGDPDFGSDVAHLPREVARNCSYLVIRQIEQDVPAFDAYCANEAARLHGRLAAPYRIDADFVAAKLVGRWQDGSSLVRHPYEPQSRAAAKPTARPDTHPADAPAVERPARASSGQDNDFLFGTEDPEALRCPFGAHVRRANPRDSLAPGSADEIDISNRHRILRVGRFYAPEPGQKPGLLFMCLNGDIERQFEFIQQTWLARPSFHDLQGEVDPLIARVPGGGPVLPSRDGPVRLAPPPPFTQVRGGGYYLLASRRLIDFLSQPPGA